MKIGPHEVPDTCPSNCLGHGEPFSQGGICHRCPVFNCQAMVGPDGEPGFRLLEPEQYRQDWAAEYLNFWKTGELPELRFEVTRVG